MRIVRRAALTAILRIQRSQAVVVAIPGGMPDPEVCDLARLVLNQSEYDELVRALEDDPASALHGATSGFDGHRGSSANPSRLG